MPPSLTYSLNRLNEVFVGFTLGRVKIVTDNKNRQSGYSPSKEGSAA
jgi:hypothetical protein